MQDASIPADNSRRQDSRAPAGGKLRVGLTYDLRDHYLSLGYSEEQTAEFDSPATIDALAEALTGLGHAPDLIGNADELNRRLVAGERWDLVFNIAEGMFGLGREALIPALLDNYEVPYTFSDPCVMALCLQKSFAKAVLRDAGLTTANYVLVRESTEVDLVDLAYPLFAKPVAEGTRKGIDGASKINNSVELKRRCCELLDRYRQPVLVEEYLPGREFTVGILGTGAGAAVLGTLEIIIREQGEQGAYSYLNKEKCEQLVEYRIPKDAAAQQAEKLSLRAWHVLGCRDAGRVDLRLDAQGQPAIIEINPLAGMHPTHSDLPMIATAQGLSYSELVRRIIASARARLAGGLAESSPPDSPAHQAVCNETRAGAC